MINSKSKVIQKAQKPESIPQTCRKKTRMFMSQDYKDKEQTALKDFLEVRFVRQAIEDHNMDLDKDDELAVMKKNLDEQIAEKQRLSDENKQLEGQIKRLTNKAVLYRRSVSVAKGNEDAAQLQLSKVRQTLEDFRKKWFDQRIELINLQAQPGFCPRKDEECNICYKPTDKTGYFVWKDCGHSITCNLCFYKHKMAINEENAANKHMPGYVKKQIMCIVCQNRNDKYVQILEQEEE